ASSRPRDKVNMRTTPGQPGVTPAPARGRCARARRLLTVVLGWVLVFVAFGQFQPTLLGSLQVFLTQADTDTSRDDDRDGDEAPVAAASAGRTHHRRGCPVVPGVDLTPAGGAFAAQPAPAPASRVRVPHLPDHREGIGAPLLC